MVTGRGKPGFAFFASRGDLSATRPEKAAFRRSVIVMMISLRHCQVTMTGRVLSVDMLYPEKGVAADAAQIPGGSHIRKGTDQGPGIRMPGGIQQVRGGAWFP